jgi:hypothetical protein
MLSSAESWGFNSDKTEAAQIARFPYLYALITAFWGVDMKWADNSRTKTVDEADDVTVHQWMKEISEREATMLTVPG